MGEKGNAADLVAAGAPEVTGFAGSAAAMAGTAVAGGASLAVDVADSATSRLVDVVVDHAIDEGRDRLRGDAAGEKPPAQGPPPNPGGGPATP